MKVKKIYEMHISQIHCEATKLLVLQ